MSSIPPLNLTNTSHAFSGAPISAPFNSGPINVGGAVAGGVGSSTIIMVAVGILGLVLIYRKG